MFACRKVAAKAKCAFAKKMNAIEVLNQWRHIGHLPWQCFGVTWSWLYYFSLQNTNNHSAWFAFVFKGLPKHKKKPLYQHALYHLVKYISVVSIVLKITKKYDEIPSMTTFWFDGTFFPEMVTVNWNQYYFIFAVFFFVKEYEIVRLTRHLLYFRKCLRRSFLLNLQQILFHASIIVFW